MKMYQVLTDVLPILLSAAAVFFAVIIPRKIMVNHIFSDLVAEYRSPEMGGAILSLIHFYEDCIKNQKNICVEYEALYKTQIKEKLKANTPVVFSSTLHFQRRLVAQFYADMGHLLDKPCARLPDNVLKTWFGKNELELLKLVLRLSGPAGGVFINIGTVPLAQANSLTDASILRLYRKVEKLLDKDTP